MYTCDKSAMGRPSVPGNGMNGNFCIGRGGLFLVGDNRFYQFIEVDGHRGYFLSAHTAKCQQIVDKVPILVAFFLITLNMRVASSLNDCA